MFQTFLLKKSKKRFLSTIAKDGHEAASSVSGHSSYFLQNKITFLARQLYINDKPFNS